MFEVCAKSSKPAVTAEAKEEGVVTLPSDVISSAAAVWRRITIEEIGERKWISRNDYEIDALARTKRKREC